MTHTESGTNLKLSEQNYDEIHELFFSIVFI